MHGHAQRRVGLHDHCARGWVQLPDFEVVEWGGGWHLLDCQLTDQTGEAREAGVRDRVEVGGVENRVDQTIYIITLVLFAGADHPRMR